MRSDGDWGTINDAAAYWSVSRRTIYTWIDEGRVRTCDTPSGRKRVLLAAKVLNKPKRDTRAAVARVLR